VPPAQVKLASQVVPPQHSCPEPPHWQVPDVHIKLALHAVPLQHA
jgi:hypothetical protein